MILGLILIAYIVPFWIWQISRHEAIEARKHLYPGRAKEIADEQRFTKLSLVWCVGLVILIAVLYASK